MLFNDGGDAILENIFEIKVLWHFFMRPEMWFDDVMNSSASVNFPYVVNSVPQAETDLVIFEIRLIVQYIYLISA